MPMAFYHISRSTKVHQRFRNVGCCLLVRNVSNLLSCDESAICCPFALESRQRNNTQQDEGRGTRNNGDSSCSCLLMLQQTIFPAIRPTSRIITSISRISRISHCTHQVFEALQTHRMEHATQMQLQPR